MSSKKEQYRNPPTPLGYVCKKELEIIHKEGIIISDECFDLIKFFAESGVFNVSDISIYQNFIPTSSLGDEDVLEIFEVPVESSPKVAEVIDIDTDVTFISSIKKSNCIEDIVIKKEVCSEKLQGTPEPLKSAEEISIISTVVPPKKVTVKTEPSEKDSKIIACEEKIKKKNNQDCEQKSRNKRVLVSLDYDSDVPSSGSKHKKNDDSDVSSKSKRKKNYESDSISHHRRSERKNKHNSDDSGDDNDHYSKKGSKKQHSPSTSSKAHEEYEVTTEDVKPEVNFGFLYGDYHCEVCNLTFNSSVTYDSHMSGKRHEKALNAQNVVRAVTKTFTATVGATKYPKPPPGYYRKKLPIPAHIQSTVDKLLYTPCPGLDNVTEIWSISGTAYYCSLCDSRCNSDSIIPHLGGFKHLLSCLKQYNYELYKKLSYKQRYQIEGQVFDELRHLEKKYGRGALKVEKDFSETDDPRDRVEMTAWEEKEITSTGLQDVGSNHSDNYKWANTPDPSKSGFHCRVCNSHCNSEAMWNSHIVGKRHDTNVKKLPGSAPSKNKYIPAPNVRPCLLDLLSDVYEPVVGLNQIREVLKPEINCRTYYCFLCCASVTDLNVIDHILSRKHREKYLEDIRHPELETTRSFGLKDSAMDSLIQDLCEKVEAKYGRGKPEVYYEKRYCL